MAGGRSITIWNLLALVVVVAGALATLGLGEMWMHRWAGTGLRMRLDDWCTLDLQAGKSLVYYESSQTVPDGGVVLTANIPREVFVPLSQAEGRPSEEEDVQRNRFPAFPLAEDISYRLMLGGQSGRALWELNLPEAGSYELRAVNTNYLSDEAVPAGDCIVFHKQPDTLAGAMDIRRGIHICGAAVTILLAVILYIKHGRVLKHLRQQE
ncbi:MAG: hypothetical protein JSV91_06905 [Phycisphaerales bacterium]|nr:MAG: hypothetical protein JSV91_06905 [Phycisphaerales bacterium]